MAQSCLEQRLPPLGNTFLVNGDPASDTTRRKCRDKFATYAGYVPHHLIGIAEELVLSAAWKQWSLDSIICKKADGFDTASPLVPEDACWLDSAGSHADDVVIKLPLNLEGAGIKEERLVLAMRTRQEVKAFIQRRADRWQPESRQALIGGADAPVLLGRVGAASGGPNRAKPYVKDQASELAKRTHQAVLASRQQRADRKHFLDSAIHSGCREAVQSPAIGFSGGAVLLGWADTTSVRATPVELRETSSTLGPSICCAKSVDNDTCNNVHESNTESTPAHEDGCSPFPAGSEMDDPENAKYVGSLDAKCVEDERLKFARQTQREVLRSLQRRADRWQPKPEEALNIPAHAPVLLGRILNSSDSVSDAKHSFDDQSLGLANRTRQAVLASIQQRADRQNFLRTRADSGRSGSVQSSGVGLAGVPVLLGRIGAAQGPATNTKILTSSPIGPSKEQMPLGQDALSWRSAMDETCTAAVAGLFLRQLFGRIFFCCHRRMQCSRVTGPLA